MNKHKIFIVNGAPTSGKTTFENICREYTNIQIMSIIDPVKELAKKTGIWNGEKTNKARTFLSNFKDILTQYDDLPMKQLVKDINTDYIPTMIDMREPQDITRFKYLYEDIFDIKTVIVRRQNDTEIAAAASNHADKEIFEYNYDITIFNYGSLDELRKTAELFVDTFILDKPLPEEYYQRFSYE